MADSYSCILSKHQHGKRFSNNHASSDDGHSFPLEFNSIVIHNVHHCLRSTRRISSSVTFEYFCKIYRTHSIHILCRVDHLSDLLYIKLLRKRLEQKNPVNLRIFIDLTESILKFFLWNIFWQFCNAALDSDHFHSLFCSTFVGKIIFFRSYPNDRKAWIYSRRIQLFSFSDQLFFHGFCHFSPSHLYAHVFLLSVLSVMVWYP